MSVVRRITQLVGVVALAATGTMLVLEATGTVTGAWRDDVATTFTDTASPTSNLWVSALIGLAAAIAGVVMFGAQFAPEKRGLRTMHNVYRDHDGATRLRGRAAISAVQHEIAPVDGVVDVVASVGRKRMHVDVKVDDRADLAAVESEVRGLLDHEFWINLGLADLALDLTISHHPKPPRVR